MASEVFDAVVIGSGFGGAVAACRLAQAGLRVLILERGRRYPRGSFPRSMDKLEAWRYSEMEQGLLEMKPLLTEMLALQVAGFGGGSLLYNNVQMRAPESLFQKGWPSSLTRKTLDPYYDLVAYMLNVVPLSDGQPLGLPERTRRLRMAAQQLGRSEQFFLPNLAVDFGEPGVLHKNKFGVEQAGCTHCGECIIGCNQHAKNTLDLNYLAIAERSGAVVRTRCQVNGIEPDRNAKGYRVLFQDFAAGGSHQAVAGRQVFVCAGAVNSTELLLRCRDEQGTLPHISSQLGHGYSANGDFLAFVFHSKEPLLPSGGPCINSAILYDHQRKGKEHTWFLLEDGGVPEQLAVRGQAVDPRRSKVKSGRALWDDVLRVMGAHLAAPTTDEDTRHSTALLLMGQDSANGALSLDRITGALRLRWALAPNFPLYTTQTRLVADVAAALGGEPVLNPTWKKLHQPITIHNLGGCGMAESPSDGVTNDHGEVFGYPGLYVLDGSTIPRAIGANPSHTIAAVAERSIEIIIRRTTGNPRWTAPERALSPQVQEPLDKVQVPVGGTAEPETPMIGISFQESMSGFLQSGWQPADDFAGAASAGKHAGAKLSFNLDISALDVDEFLRDPDHTAVATGRLHAPGFTGAHGAQISAGVFNLFAETGQADARKMLYALPFYGEDGQPYLLDGFKDVRDHGHFDVWQANTTLYSVIREGHSRQGEIRATGILYIDLPQVLRLVSTMHVSGAANAAERAWVIERFCAAFFGTLWKVYIEPKLPKLF